jgi:hypothetical protein
MARNVYKTPLPTHMKEIAILFPDDAKKRMQGHIT